MDLRVAAYAVILDDDGRILLSHWSQGRHPAWTMPGGGMEDGEDPVDTVRREVREETGYRVAVGDLLGIHSQVIPASRRIAPGALVPMQALRIIYRARITGGRLRFEQGGSTDRAGWFGIDAARRLTHVKLVDVAMKMAGLTAPAAR